MEPKKETATGFQLKELGNKFLEGIHVDKDATREELDNILNKKFNVINIPITINNRSGHRIRILDDVEENKLGFKHLAIMLVDNHPLFEGWRDEFKIREFDRIITMKIQDFENGKTESEIKTEEEAIPYRKFQESIQKLIPPPPAKDELPKEYKKQPGAFDVGLKINIKN